MIFKLFNIHWIMLSFIKHHFSNASIVHFTCCTAETAISVISFYLVVLFYYYAILYLCRYRFFFSREKIDMIRSMVKERYWCHANSSDTHVCLTNMCDDINTFEQWKHGPLCGPKFTASMQFSCLNLYLRAKTCMDDMPKCWYQES